jgi:hypothetical protein
MHSVKTMTASFGTHHGLLCSKLSFYILEHYIQAIAALFANLSPFPDLLRPIVDAHLVAGSGPSALSSNTIKTTIEEAPELFYTLSCVTSIVKKVNASIGENPSISRPAREAKELLKTVPPYMDDNDVQSLF